MQPPVSHQQVTCVESSSPFEMLGVHLKSAQPVLTELTKVLLPPSLELSFLNPPVSVATENFRTFRFLHD